MIEKYFSESNIVLDKVRDNGISISFICFDPENVDASGEPKRETVTLFDSDLARAYGIRHPWRYTRSGFVAEMAELFPIDHNEYEVPDWELPIPDEWIQSAVSYVKSWRDRRLFKAISVSILRDLEPPLYRWVVLNMVVGMYPIFSPESRVIPGDLAFCKEHPERLLEDPE